MIGEMLMSNPKHQSHLEVQTLQKKIQHILGLLRSIRSQSLRLARHDSLFHIIKRTLQEVKLSTFGIQVNVDGQQINLEIALFGKDNLLSKICSNHNHNDTWLGQIRNLVNIGIRNGQIVQCNLNSYFNNSELFRMLPVLPCNFKKTSVSTYNLDLLNRSKAFTKKFQLTTQG
jgi:hypothetical protein